MTITKDQFLSKLTLLKQKQLKHHQLLKTESDLLQAKETLIDMLNDDFKTIPQLKNYHPVNIKPFLVSHTLSIFSMNPYIAKRLYRKHKLYRGSKLILLYTCEIIKADYVIRSEDGLVFGGENVWNEFCEVVGFMEFRTIKDFFGLNEEIVKRKMEM